MTTMTAATVIRPRILVLEDRSEDAELMLRELCIDSMVPDFTVAASEPEFRAELDRRAGRLDLILVDFSVPGFSGVAALAAAHDAEPAVPCIMVSGVLGEELAVTAMRAGATDYVTKRRLDLLGPAVRRALHEADEAREVHRLEAALAAAEATVAAASASQEEIRRTLGEVLHRVPDGASIIAVAGAVCEQLTVLPGIDTAAVLVHVGDDRVRVVAARDGGAGLLAEGGELPSVCASLIRDRTTSGPWSMCLPGEAGLDDMAGGDPEARALGRLGLAALITGPVIHGDHVDGELVLGTTEPAFAAALAADLSGVMTYAATASALLAERLHAERRTADVRSVITSVLDRGAFRAVFQPVVDLETGEVVAYEALTRLLANTRPDVFFAEAWRVGVGIDVELATLTLAVEESQHLPSGRWLHLNISPRLLLGERTQLAHLFDATGRPVVVEITEHEPIDDYQAIREAIHGLGRDLRVAVDDAGAGVANFGHIIALRPNFVKLDINLVRGVNADLGRQALVVGMRHFSRTAGCQLVAEGIEVAAEASILRSLGVGFGQGYLFGRPEPAITWARASTSVSF